MAYRIKIVGLLAVSSFDTYMWRMRASRLLHDQMGYKRLKYAPNAYFFQSHMSNSHVSTHIESRLSNTHCAKRYT